MQIKIFTIPVIGGEQLTREMNLFFRSRRILKIESQMVNFNNGAFWSFCIQYLEGDISDQKNLRVDYKEVLDQGSFERFSKMRIIRKRIAKEEAIPAYAVFTDRELAELAQIKNLLTLENMKQIKGIGEKKVEKYGNFFISENTEDEKSQ